VTGFEDAAELQNRTQRIHGRTTLNFPAMTRLLTGGLISARATAGRTSRLPPSEFSS